ncbi:MAG: hypothetical protein ACYCY9_07655 [Thiobacillus sp.]
MVDQDNGRNLNDKRWRAQAPASSLLEEGEFWYRAATNTEMDAA